MDEHHEPSGKLFRDWAPWFLTMLSILTAVWTMSNSFSTIRIVQSEHGRSIDNISKGLNDQQALLYSISTQLAQVQQSVTDIKANETTKH